MKRNKTDHKDQNGNEIYEGDVLRTVEFNGDYDEEYFYVVRPAMVMMAVPVEPLYDEELESIPLSKLRTLGDRKIAGFARVDTVNLNVAINKDQ